MPVRKFRDVSEMEDTLWRKPGDPDLHRAIAGVWDFAARVFPRHFPPGVYRHRSIEEAKALREQWETADFEAFHQNRKAGQRQS
jgi:hypothetical protein